MASAHKSPWAVMAMVAVWVLCGGVPIGVEGDALDSSQANSEWRGKPVVFVFTDVNLDDVQAIKLLLKYSDKLDVGGLVPVCTGWCNMGPAIQNLFGLLSFMNRDDVPVWAGDAYALSEQTSGLYGCTYERSIPLFPVGKVWSDTIVGLNRRYPPPPEGHEKDRNYYPGFPSVYDNSTLESAVTAIEPDRPVHFLSLGSFTTIDRLFQLKPYLKRRVDRIWAMGGALRVEGNLFWPLGHPPNTFAEYNMYLDPEAARSVIESGVPITLIPLDATDSFQVTQEFLSKFAQVMRTKEARFCHDLLEIILSNSPPGLHYAEWDVITTAIMADPQLVIKKEILNVTVIVDPTSRQVGRTVIDNQHGRSLEVVTVVEPTFMDYFVKIINQP